MKTITPLLVILLLAFGCTKEETPQPNVPAKNLNAARVSTPGVVYLPLNIILKGNTKAYSGTWSQAVDLDSDTTIDFTFSLSLARSAGNDFYQFTSQISANQPGGGVISTYMPTALSGMPYAWVSNPIAASVAIGPASQTFASPSLPATYAYSFYFGARRGGTIIGKGDKWVGMRFVSKGLTYYGWLKINIASNSQTFTIKEAAFMNLPETPILAGQLQ